MHLDIDERHLLRLGHGEEMLETEKDFSRYGRVNYVLQQRLALLKEVSTYRWVRIKLLWFSKISHFLSLEIQMSKFKSTKTVNMMIYNIIKKSRSKSGGLSQIGYGSVRRMCQSKQQGRS